MQHKLIRAVALRTNDIFTGRFWHTLYWHFGTHEGFFVVLLKESMRYLKSHFRPGAEGTRELLSSALTKLDRMGVNLPLPQ